MQKQEKGTRDLGSGSVGKLLAQLAIPAVVAQIINLLYNIIDRIYIGHIPVVGTDALTGVGLFMPILMLINAFAMLAGSGGAPLAAIAMGRQDNRRAERIMANCFSLLLIFAVVLTVGFYLFAPQLLQFFGASEDTLGYAVDYARIYILGSVTVLIVMGMNPFVTTQGFAKISMLTTVIGAAINIVLDPIFIFVLDMGVKGAALATVLSQAVGALWILHFLTRGNSTLKLRRADLRWEGEIVRSVFALGISTFVMLATESVLSISFTSSLQRYGGDIAVGAMTVITSVSQLITMPLQGVCQGAQPILSYNYGAGNTARVKRAFFTEFLLCVGYATLCWALLMTLPEVFVKIFNDDAAFVGYTAWALRIYMACVFATGFQISCQQSFVALGQAKVSLVMACLRKIVLLIPLIFILPHFWEDQVFAVFLAEPVSDLLAATVTTVTFLTSLNRILKKAPQRSAGA